LRPGRARLTFCRRDTGCSPPPPHYRCRFCRVVFPVRPPATTVHEVTLLLGHLGVRHPREALPQKSVLLLIYPRFSGLILTMVSSILTFKAKPPETPHASSPRCPGEEGLPRSSATPSPSWRTPTPRSAEHAWRSPARGTGCSSDAAAPRVMSGGLTPRASTNSPPVSIMTRFATGELAPATIRAFGPSVSPGNKATIPDLARSHSVSSCRISVKQGAGVHLQV
jgi:hypothetical protein